MALLFGLPRFAVGITVVLLGFLRHPNLRFLRRLGLSLFS